MTKPIHHCYWVDQHRLLAGEYPRNRDEASSPAKLDALIQAGVRAFIDLTEATEGLKPYSHLLQPYEATGVSYQRFSLRDGSVPESTVQVRQILDVIDAHIHQQRLVYVHCWGGVGRTGVIIGCWLARHGHPGAAALQRVRQL